jgi:hypothetical protein
MAEDKKISLGIYKSQQKLLGAMFGIVTVPSSLKIVDINTGILNEGEGNQRSWANLTVVDTLLYEKFESIGQEKFCPTFKVKLKNYLGEDLSQLQDMEISFETYELAFITEKYKQPLGFALVLELDTISVNWEISTMKKVQSVFRKFISLKWYYQLAIALASTGVVALLVKFLIWFVPIIGATLARLFVFTEGEIFSTMWESYNQRKQSPSNPLFITVYHRLAEHCVTDLPVSTLQFVQGVEFPDINQGLYFVHIEKEITDGLL